MLADVDALVGDGRASFGLEWLEWLEWQWHRIDRANKPNIQLQMTKTYLVPGYLCHDNGLCFSRGSGYQSLTGWRPHLRDWFWQSELTLLGYRRLMQRGRSGSITTVICSRLIPLQTESKM